MSSIVVGGRCSGKSYMTKLAAITQLTKLKTALESLDCDSDVLDALHMAIESLNENPYSGCAVLIDEKLLSRRQWMCIHHPKLCSEDTMGGVQNCPHQVADAPHSSWKLSQYDCDDFNMTCDKCWSLPAFPAVITRRQWMRDNHPERMLSKYDLTSSGGVVGCPYMVKDAPDASWAVTHDECDEDCTTCWGQPAYPDDVKED